MTNVMLSWSRMTTVEVVRVVRLCVYSENKMTTISYRLDMQSESVSNMTPAS